MSDLLWFLEGRRLSAHGLAIDDIITADDAQLERDHQYIQWVFPNRAPSRFNPWAPVLLDSDIADIRGSAAALENLERALARMRAFYRATTGWRQPRDHNQLRITRIIEAATLLLGREAGGVFLSEIEEMVAANPGGVSDLTLGIWRDRYAECSALVQEGGEPAP